MSPTGADEDRSARFDVLITSAGAAPAAVSRAIRTASIPAGRFLSSRQAEAIVSGAPTMVAEGIGRVQATRLERALRRAGADCRIVERGARPAQPQVID